jgi:hypothetical protein
MRCWTLTAIAFLLVVGCKESLKDSNRHLIGKGQMPNVVTDNSGIIHVVYGEGDDIMYTSSADGGNKFSEPVSISALPELAASHMRGPQIAATSSGLIVTACTEAGDIYSFTKSSSGNWEKGNRLNDVDTVAKENLMALSADGQLAFAVWLDLRDKHNEIYGARSTDGGQTWRKNILVYASPDTTVCECCKPSVLIKGNEVHVMFRNWLNGNRDMYLIASTDGGASFGNAQKLGSASWALNGCPMDGGAMAIGSDGNIETVWRRKQMIYACEPGETEMEIGDGKNCTMLSVNGKNIYAWTNDGDIVVMKPQGMKKTLGTGSMPVLAQINNEHVICVWENDQKIYAEVFEL